MVSTKSLKPVPCSAEMRAGSPRPSAKGLQDAGLRQAPLAFVGGDNYRLARATHQFGEGLVGADDAGPRVDEEEDEVRLVDGRYSLLAHAGCETVLAGFEPGSIDEPHHAAADARLCLAPVASEPRLVVDKGEPLAREPVEQRGFADIRPSDDGDGEQHGLVRSGAWSETRGCRRLRVS